MPVTIRKFGAAALFVGSVGLSLAVVFAIPLAWLWIGSALQGGLDPSFGALMIVLVGVTVSYSGLGAALAWARGRHSQEGRPARHAWTRSMRDERSEATWSAGWVERLAVVTVLAVGIACLAIFFFAGLHPGFRPTP